MSCPKERCGLPAGNDPSSNLKRSFRSLRQSILAVLVATSFLAVNAQDVPTVSFGFYFPGSEPERYRIVVPASGDASYASNGKLTEKSDNDDFKMTFTLSDSARSRIFDLTKKAGYFERELDSKKRVASTGEKTLEYKNGSKITVQTYNYSSNPAVQQLTEAFQDLSTTLEFGRRLDYYHHYQKLALDEELKRMEDMQKDNNLPEVSAIASIMNQIVADSTLINPVRARAQRILAKAGLPVPR